MTEIGKTTIQLEEDGLQEFGPMRETIQHDVCAGKYDDIIERLMAEERAVNANISRRADLSIDE